MRGVPAKIAPSRPAHSSVDLWRVFSRPSRADPFVVCLQPHPVTKKWREFGRTEVVPNSLNPDFAKQVVLDFHFEETQPLRFAVFDRDAPTDDLQKHDFIGEVETTLGEIVGRCVARHGTLLWGLPPLVQHAANSPPLRWRCCCSRPTV